MRWSVPPAPALLLIVWTDDSRAVSAFLACKQSVRLSDGRARGFAKRTSASEPIYFLDFTALLLWFLVVAYLLPPSNHPPRRNFECFSRIRIGRPRCAAGQSAAVDTRWGRTTDGRTDSPARNGVGGHPRGAADNATAAGGVDPRFLVIRSPEPRLELENASLQ